jgi:hypothetical protein
MQNHKRFRLPELSYYLNFPKKASMHENKVNNDIFLLGKSNDQTTALVSEDSIGACLSELLTLPSGRLRERIKVVAEDSRMLRALCSREDQVQSPFFATLIWVEAKLRSSSFEAMENLERCLSLCSAGAQKKLSKEDQAWLVQILEGISELIRSNSLGYCKRGVLDFLFRIFLKSSSAADTTKTLALGLFIRASDPMEKEDVERLIAEFENLDEFTTNGVRFREVVLLQFFRHFTSHNTRNYELFISALLRPYFASESNLFVRSTMCCCASIMNRDAHAKMLCISFVLLFFSEFKKGVENDVVYVLGTILNNLLPGLRKEQPDVLEKVLGKPPSFLLKLSRSLFFYLLELMNKKRDPSRMVAARALVSADLCNLSLGRKVVAQVTKLCRRAVSEKQATLVDAAIGILCRVNTNALLAELRHPHPPSTKKRIFDQVKSAACSDDCYMTYLELLSSELTRDVEFQIEDLARFSKVFYSYAQKDVAQHLSIEVDKIEDVYVAELVFFYSKYHPKDVDEVYAASLLLENGGEIVKSKNTSFYNMILKILVNISASMSVALKRRIVHLLKRLVFYSPYTKNAGMLMSVLGGTAPDPGKGSDFAVVVYGAVGSPRFREAFSEYPWSPNKEMALIYYLQFDPSLGQTYKWKLEEVIGRTAQIRGEKENLAVSELLLFLREILEREASDFYFSFVAKNHAFIALGVEHPEGQISREACLLLRTATDLRAILPHFSIPYLLSYHRMLPEYICIYEEAVLNTIKETVEVKLREFRRREGVGDCRMLYEIYTHIADKETMAKRLIRLLDDCALKTYYLLMQAMLFDRRSRLLIFGAVEDRLHMYSVDTNRLLVKIQALFLDAGHRRHPVRLSNESVLFRSRVDAEEVDALQLLLAGKKTCQSHVVD